MLNVPAVTGNEIIKLTSFEITAFRGSDTDGPAHWFSTDADHASYFGAVTKHDLFEYDVIVLDTDHHPDLARGGYESDDALVELMVELDAEMAVLHNWEGTGICINPHWGHDWLRVTRKLNVVRVDWRELTNYNWSALTEGRPITVGRPSFSHPVPQGRGFGSSKRKRHVDAQQYWNPERRREHRLHLLPPRRLPVIQRPDAAGTLQ